MADNMQANAPAANAQPQPSTTKFEGKKKPNIKRPVNKISKAQLPKPTHLTNKETPLTNDPLWKDSFVLDGETGFVNEANTKEINADAAGYVHLIEIERSEYKAITDRDKTYSKAVSASAHAYYHNILYWYKLALNSQKNGTASIEQDRLVSFVQGYGTAVTAAGAGEYLEGLGDYTDATGVKHLLVAREPNANGHFGQATATTHGFYETLPAPAIALHRVIADFEASQRDGNPNDAWIIAGIAPQQPRQQPVVPPEVDAAQRRRRALRHDEEEGAPDEDAEGGAPHEPEVEDEAPPAISPTVKLLGWRPSKQLSKNQMAELDNVFDPEDPMEGLTIARYAVKRGLFELVARKLREVKTYKTSLIPHSTGGSIVQQVVWRPTELSKSRFKMAIELEGTACSRTTLPLRAAVAAKIMCYRSKSISCLR